jgi:signal transduction histidine kinase
MEKILRDVEVIEKESLRARDIVHQLLQFSRKQPLLMKTVDMNKLLVSVIELVGVQIKDSRMKVEKDFSGIPLIEGDENQLKQVFLNIISNAIYSMHNAGTLGVRTRLSGETVLVEVSDTGSGIPREIMDRIFEPFFTTKNEKGTGLGLSISFKIVQGHGGNIEVESQPGKGSRFTVRLPVGTARKKMGGRAALS